MVRDQGAKSLYLNRLMPLEFCRKWRMVGLSLSVPRHSVMKSETGWSRLAMWPWAIARPMTIPTTILAMDLEAMRSSGWCPPK
jgi:hypothetical protein